VLVKPGDVIQLLSTGNPWWQRPTDWGGRDVQLRAADASGLRYHPDVLSDVPPGSLVLLRGPRRVGKSVELKRYVQQTVADGAPPRAVIHAAVDGLGANDLRTLVGVGKRLAPPGTAHRWWLIDEIGAITAWAEAIKHLRDNDVEFAEDTVILTGSSAADLTSATSHLAGRRGPVSHPDRTLLPMGFRTFANLMLSSRGQPTPDTPGLAPHELRGAPARETYSRMVPWLADLVTWWEIYLQCGGFPQSVAAQISGGDPGPVVQALFDVVQRDAFGAASLSETQTVGLLARLSDNLTSPINASTIASDLGISHDTVNRRLENLTTAYLTWPCYQSDRLRPRLGAQAKRYFTDPLLARLAHLRRSTHPAPDVTRLTEQQLGMALIRHLENANPGSYAGYDDVLFERTPTRKEIDFVGHRLAPVALEGKYTDRGRWVGESATLNASAHSGVLATRSVLDTTAPDAGASWAVPAAVLAYCIDV
jgi:uncharacterized protein